MNITTPKTQQTGFEKRLHTPPIIERTKGRTTPTKFLKTVSDNIFKRNFDSKEQYPHNFGSNVKNIHFSQTPRMARRFKTPKPLDLSKPISPPKTITKQEELTINASIQGSFQSLENIHLSSPGILQGTNYNKPKNLTNLLYDAFDSPTIENQQSLKTNYIEYNDILSHHSKKTPLSNINTGKYFKKYSREECCICKEAIAHNFMGEKIVELSCSHLTHFNCYLTLYDSGLNYNMLPICGVCNVEISPKDSELMNLLASTLLTQTKKRTLIPSSKAAPSTKISVSDQSEVFARPYPQYFELKSAKIVDSSFKSYTPLDQLIKSADISSNGFQNELGNKTSDSNESLVCLSSGSETLSLFHSMSPSTTSESSCLEKISPVVTWCERNDRVVIEVKFECNEIDTCAASEVSTNKLKEREINVIYSEIIQFIREEILLESLIGSKTLNELKLFDTVTYSTDNNIWHENILLFYVDDVIILFNIVMNKVVGEVSCIDITRVHILNDSVLIIVTKSRKMPEIFLKFNSGYLTKKWKYYLQNQENPFTNSLNHLTTTALFILPDLLKYKIQGYADLQNNVNVPWLLKKDSPIRLILCLNLCTISTKDPHLYRDRLVTIIHKIVNSLSEIDMLGLVTISPNDESGGTPFSSTYVGMINKSWDGWTSIIDDLKVSDYQEEIYYGENRELEIILQTCFKLISTLPENESMTFQNHILYLSQLEDMETDLSKLMLNSKLQDTIFNKYRFSISEYYLYDCQNPVKKVVDDLHHLKYYNIRVNIKEEDIYVGHINDVKEVVLNNCEMLDILTTASRCEVTWEEKDKGNNFARTVPLLRKEL
ncbi:hypothetical protein RI543_000177 [Arxiozyma heterogenica]|uniref:RING-type domain-containing protein n=1 Tax=Arxiozyma heterogenica TaxID=278026 RepID=A0AAN7WQZ5_9SACH|nr:hypothetical protein RI543_000177 [Kazachstania heterogenica]